MKTWRQIEASRERRLWITQVILPIVGFVTTVAMVKPDLYEKAKEKASEITEKIKTKIKQQTEREDSRLNTQGLLFVFAIFTCSFMDTYILKEVLDMFWIGMLVGIVLVIACGLVFVIHYLKKDVGVTVNEWVDIVYRMEGVGHNRDASIVITTNEGTEHEDIDTIYLKK